MEIDNHPRRDQNIHTFIGQYHILQGVSVQVPKGSITALLGRNGAGKTTTLKSILGLTPPREGKVVFDGTRDPGHALLRHRLAGHRLRARAPRHLPRPERGGEPEDRRTQKGRPTRARQNSSSSFSPTSNA
jgi:ABC-type oligopeptide transport system ATPase subunit